MKHISLNRTVAIGISLMLAVVSFPQVPKGQSWGDLAYGRFAKTKNGKISLQKIRKVNAQRTSIVAKALKASTRDAKATSTNKGDIEELRAYQAAIEAYYQAHPELAEAEAKYAQEWQADRTRAEKELKLGHYTKVVSILQPRLNARPDEGMDVDYLADAYFQLGQIDDAYYALMPSLGPNNGGMERILVRASLATALKGQVQPGQWEYCVQSIRGCVSDDSAVQNSIPRTRDIKGLQMLSYLATGLDRTFNGSRDDDMTIFYLHKALELDPGNPVANRHIIDPLMRKERFVEALACLERGLPRASSGYKDALEFVHRDLKYIVKHLKD